MSIFGFGAVIQSYFNSCRVFLCDSGTVHSISVEKCIWFIFQKKQNNCKRGVGKIVVCVCVPVCQEQRLNFRSWKLYNMMWFGTDIFPYSISLDRCKSKGVAHLSSWSGPNFLCYNKHLVFPLALCFWSRCWLQCSKKNFIWKHYHVNSQHSAYNSVKVFLGNIVNKTVTEDY